MSMYEAAPEVYIPAERALHFVNSGRWADYIGARKRDRSIYFVPDRRHSSAVKRLLKRLVPEVAAGTLPPYERLHEGTRFYPDNYPAKSLIEFNAEYVVRQTYPKFNSITRDRYGEAVSFESEALESSPVELMPKAGIPRSDTGPYLSGAKVTERFANIALRETSHSRHRWYGVILKTCNGNELFSVADLEEMDNFCRLIFPLHDPAIVGTPTQATSLDSSGKIEEVSELIHDITIYYEPQVWQELYNQTSLAQLGKRALSSALARLK